MNIAMEQTEEFVDGQLKAKYGDCFIRGNNGECNLQYLLASYIYIEIEAVLYSPLDTSITVLYISGQKRK